MHAWEHTAPLDRWGHAIAQGPGGSMLLFGGVTSTAHLYRQAAEAREGDDYRRGWEESSAGLVTGVIRAEYEFGYHHRSDSCRFKVLRDMWEYDGSGAWHRLDSPADPPGFSERYDHSLSLHADGRAIVVGGTDAAGHVSASVLVCDVGFRPICLSRQPVHGDGSAALRRQRHGAVLCHGGAVLAVVGGEGPCREQYHDVVLMHLTTDNTPWAVLSRHEVLPAPASNFQLSPYADSGRVRWPDMPDSPSSVGVSVVIGSEKGCALLSAWALVIVCRGDDGSDVAVGLAKLNTANAPPRRPHFAMVAVDVLQHTSGDDIHTERNRLFGAIAMSATAADRAAAVQQAFATLGIPVLVHGGLAAGGPLADWWVLLPGQSCRWLSISHQMGSLTPGRSLATGWALQRAHHTAGVCGLSPGRAPHVLLFGGSDAASYHSVHEQRPNGSVFAHRAYQFDALAFASQCRVPGVGRKEAPREAAAHYTDTRSTFSIDVQRNYNAGTFDIGLQERAQVAADHWVLPALDGLPEEANHRQKTRATPITTPPRLSPNNSSPSAAQKAAPSPTPAVLPITEASMSSPLNDRRQSSRTQNLSTQERYFSYAFAGSPAASLRVTKKSHRTHL